MSGCNDRWIQVLKREWACLWNIFKHFEINDFCFFGKKETGSHPCASLDHLTFSGPVLQTTSLSYLYRPSVLKQRVGLTDYPLL